MQLLNVFLFWIFFGLLCAYLAHRQKKNRALWFMIGLFLGIFGVALILILPWLEGRAKAMAYKSAPVIPTPPLIQEQPKLWYYLDATRQTQGPIGFPELASLWKEQSLTEQSYVWKEGMEEWKRLSEISELAKELKS